MVPGIESIPLPDRIAGPALLLGLAGAPVVAALVARRWALEPGRRPADALFGFRLLTSWLTLLLWLMWPLVVVDWQAARVLQALASLYGSFAIQATMLACSLLPQLAATIVILVISRQVTRQLRHEDWSDDDSRRQLHLQLTALAIGAVGIGIAGSLAMNAAYRPAVLIATVALSATIACMARYRRLAGLELHAVTFGELRTRLFDMAATVGIPLKQLHIMPMARSRIANAFAVSDQSVILTDYLIQRLSRRELEAVMAHEIAHLRLKHPRKLALAMAVVVAPAVIVLMYLDRYRYLGLVVLAGLLVRLVVARRFEYQADREAVRICGDPEALISGLAALGEANVLPLHWNRRVELLMTHPSTLRRIQRIAAESGVTADRLAALLGREGLGDGCYDLPRTLTGKAFSSVYKRKMIQRLTLIRLAIAAGVPALLISIGGYLTPRPVLFWAAAVLAFLALLLFHERLAVAVIAALETQVRRRETADDSGVDRTFVSLSPGDAPRVYEGFLDWDLGLLTTAADHLEYSGEETRFTLGRADVTAVELTRGYPAWIRVPWVRIAWRDASGAEGSFCLRPADAHRLSETHAAAKRVFERLESWRVGPAPAAAAATADDAHALPPREDSVTGTPLARVVSLRAFIPVFPWLLVATAIACALFGLPFDPFHGPGWLETVGAGLVAMIAFQLPYWLFVRAPRTSPARQPA
jgi:Zn-dependent protease with chaperone function